MPRPADSPDQPLRVLVIEDDLVFRKVISTFLRQSSAESFDVTLAEDLTSGLARLDERPVADAVLLDLTLPDSEGLETLRRVQDHQPGVPIIVLTGLDDEQVAAEAVRRGAQDFLVKSDLNASILGRSVRYAVERHRAEAALRESESRFRAVVEDQTELVCRFLPDGTLSFVNPAFCRYFDATAEDLLGSSFFRLTHVNAARFAFGEVERPTRSREQHLELGEASVWVQWTDRALFDAHGELTQYQSVGRDVTEQKSLERQLYQSQKTETLGRLAGGVAHDFNNLLTVIIGCCEMLGMERRRSGLGPHPQISEIAKAAERATALTRQLLAVSRRHVAQPAVLDLNQVVRQTEEMLRRLISEQVDLVVRLDPAVPAIKADRAQVEQILVNLAVNARDAMPEGGQLTIETAAGETETGTEAVAELAVSDDGVGMDHQTREKIFEPFFTTKEVGKGTGLGLSIVDSLVKESRGSIALETALGQGSTFRVRFPETRESPEEAPAAPPRVESGRRSGSVLLVEDEALVRDVVRSLLEPQGYDVEGTASAEEALARLGERRHQFDVLLTDVVLPGLNGFQLAEQVKARFPRIRILFMSGYADVTQEKQRWLGAETHFIQKPFSAGELLAKLDEIFDSRP